VSKCAVAAESWWREMTTTARSLAEFDIPLIFYPITVIFTDMGGVVVNMQTIREPHQRVVIPPLSGPTTLTMDYADGATYETVVCR
jgi:hypothetical protein